MRIDGWNWAAAALSVLTTTAAATEMPYTFDRTYNFDSLYELYMFDKVERLSGRVDEVVARVATLASERDAALGLASLVATLQRRIDALELHAVGNFGAGVGGGLGGALGAGVGSSSMTPVIVAAQSALPLAPAANAVTVHTAESAATTASAASKVVHIPDVAAMAAPAAATLTTLRPLTATTASAIKPSPPSVATAAARAAEPFDTDDRAALGGTGDAVDFEFSTDDKGPHIKGDNNAASDVSPAYEIYEAAGGEDSPSRDRRRLTAAPWPDFASLGTHPAGGASAWALALNVDTGDGHMVDYSNYEFWQSATLSGGAATSAASALTGDFKDVAVFGSLIVAKILVVVHEEGVAKGWRTWNAADASHPLAWYFSSGVNSCAGPTTVLSNGQCTTLATSTTGGDVGSLLPEEPLVNNLGAFSSLYTNTGNGDSDFNRISTACFTPANSGWGLGTLYDAGADGGGDVCVRTNSARPIADAMFHAGTATVGSTWGCGGSPVGGLVGTDNTCNTCVSCSTPGVFEPCPWTKASGYNYDYAIYVAGPASLACAAGSASLDGSTRCDVCPAGTAAGPGASACTACPHGQWQPAAGQAACLFTPAPTPAPSPNPTMQKITLISSSSVSSPEMRSETLRTGVLYADEIILQGEPWIPARRFLASHNSDLDKRGSDEDRLAARTNQMLLEAAVKALQNDVALIQRTTSGGAL